MSEQKKPMGTCRMTNPDHFGYKPHLESTACECWKPVTEDPAPPQGEPATTCVKCKRDAADRHGPAYLFDKGPYCGTSDYTQPMWACRFGRAPYEEASKDWEPMRVLRLGEPAVSDDRLNDVILGSEVEDQGRDLLASVIDSYLHEVTELRAYDLVDRIHRRLNQAAWWLVPAENLKGLIVEADSLRAALTTAEDERDRVNGIMETQGRTIELLRDVQRSSDEMVDQLRSDYRTAKERATTAEAERDQLRRIVEKVIEECDYSDDGWRSDPFKDTFKIYVESDLIDLLRAVTTREVTDNG